MTPAPIPPGDDGREPRNYPFADADKYLKRGIDDLWTALNLYANLGYDTRVERIRTALVVLQPADL